MPVPEKSHLSVSAASEVGFPTLSSSPEQDVLKPADSDQQMLRSPPPSYNTALAPPDPSLEVTAEPSPPVVASIEEAESVVEETKLDRNLEEARTMACCPSPPDGFSEPEPQHAGTMNGSAVLSEGSLVVSELCCSVEQAEEIMGTEATGLALGGAAQLDDFPCIPVEHAVAVECDEQVLGEFDAAGIAEVSRRIYALENMSSFRRPRKNSDK